MAGVPKKALGAKLGFKSGYRVFVQNEPPTYKEDLGKMPTNVVFAQSLRGKFDLLHYFTKNSADLTKNFAKFKQYLESDGTLWISWPKPGTELQTDLTENGVREIGMKEGLVDVKACPIDESWEGLKFVFRKKAR